MKEAVLKNLGVFLGRVDLKGAEVPMFEEVIRELQAIPIEKEKVEEKKEEDKVEVKEVPTDK